MKDTYTPAPKRYDNGSGTFITMRCFACNKILGNNPVLVTCQDEQDVYVGRECFKHIALAGAAGYQPPKGGPRLFMLRFDPKGAR